MGDIVISEGLNELNVSLVPIVAPPPAMLEITGFAVPSFAIAGTTISAIVTYKITGVVYPGVANLYATNEGYEKIASSSALSAVPGTHTVTLNFIAKWWKVYCYIRFSTQDIPDGWAYSGTSIIHY